MSFFENDIHVNELPSDRRVYSVSDLTREVKLTLENHFPPVWVEGEISNFKRHSSGHFYFSLKDEYAQLSCTMWRGRNQGLLFNPEDGMKVLAMGNMTVYERQGRYQLDVMLMQPAGIGELQMAFESMKQRLKEEGLFDSEYKQSLPEFPQRIGIVTSPTGAAIRDIVSVVHRRFPGVQIILYPVRVQGSGAAEEIAQAIDTFNEYGGVDVLIVGRGGGSLEDLWAFNEEIVARAIFKSSIPVISAVGHEVDFSISDFVSDVRAPTPSAAAELVVRDREDLHHMLSFHALRMWRFLQRKISIEKERVTAIKHRYAFRQPLDCVRENRLRMDEIHRSMERSYQHRLEEEILNVSRLKARLRALNPRGVLDRGYSITTRIRDGAVLRGSKETEVQEHLRIQLAKGAVRTVVEEVEE
ncbi:exodeoxyribonuclease VII large subunit [bacterium]|nr:exodeoxyribonuclease VII large subunit [bacterium]